MITKLSKAVTTVSMPLLVLMGTVTLTYADDTEIYFNTDKNKVKPNVLFILDKSLSMKKTPAGKEENFDNGQVSKINLLKEALQLIFDNKEKSIKGMRVGLMTFSTDAILQREMLDIDQIDEKRNIEHLNPIYHNDGTTTFDQTIWITSNDGYQNLYGKGYPNFTKEKVDIDGSYRDNLKLSGNKIFGFRFDNILIKNPQGANNTGSGEGAPNYGVVKAELKIKVKLTQEKNYIRIYVDPEADSVYFRQRTAFDLSNRVAKAKKAGNAYETVCELGKGNGKEEFKTCDVSDLVRTIISSKDWKDGNAISFILENATGKNGDKINSGSDAINIGRITFSEKYKIDKSQLTITAKNNAIALNKRTKKEAILDSGFAINASGLTEVNRALLAGSMYVSNIPHEGKAGPYHDDGSKKKLYTKSEFVESTASPLVEGCQLTHFILMSDGQPNTPHTADVQAYMGSSCRINGKLDDGKNNRGGEECSRALVNWLTQTDHSEKKDSKFDGPNYIYTHAISFGMSDDNGTPKKKDKIALQFLKDIAAYGHGVFRETNDADDLADAFKSIMSAALSINGTAVSGQVVATAKDIYKQRREAFYSIFQSQQLDYWPGNVKGFKLVYKKVEVVKGVETEIPVLKSWDETEPAIDPKTGSIASAVSSAWSNGDGNNVFAGGVAAQLPDDPAERNMFTFNSSKNKQVINSAANITTKQLAVEDLEDAEQVKKGLLNFIRGYMYQLGGSTLPGQNKIGDAISSGVTLISYGCDGAKDKSIIDCAYDNLNLVGLSASNDGILRGYNLTDGSTLYEIMPEQMLPIIKKLQKPVSLQEYIEDPNDTNKLINKMTTKTYGLDGKVVIYHEDTNQNDFIDNGEAAYAFVASGRGGPYIYGFDISNKTNPKLLWVHTNDNGDFSNLGETWSEPVIGKIKVNGAKVPVIIFGAGYDNSLSQLQQDGQPPARKNDNIGTAVYMLNAISGQVIATIHADAMTFSIPGGVATLKSDKSDPELITDLFFGDMGGQLWRFRIDNNAGTAKQIVYPAGGQHGLIASISGSDVHNSRRFYQKPFIYDFISEKGLKDSSLKNYLAINIGSGYKPHPLVTDNQDRFYSIRVPKDPTTATNNVIEEKDLALLTLENKEGDTNYVDNSHTGNIKNGFMIKLDAIKGEKVLSNPYAVQGRVAFNTYVPDNTVNAVNCLPNMGKQRLYVIDIVSGRNLLHSQFIETDAITIPNDITIYCSDRACSIISGTHALDGNIIHFDVGISKTNCEKDPKGCTPLNLNNITKTIKTTWTDLFGPSVNR